MTCFAASFAEHAVRPRPVLGVSQDTLLVTAARRGDRGAFGLLYDRYARMVHGVLLARVPIDDVEDLVHEVFLQALRRLASLRGDAAFGGWLAAIARNAANDYHRHTVPPFPSTTRTHGATKANSQPRRPMSKPRWCSTPFGLCPRLIKSLLILRLVEGHDRPGDCRAHRTHSRLGPRESPGNATIARTAAPPVLSPFAATGVTVTMTSPHETRGNAPPKITDDYLWDGLGEPDPEVRALETLLAPLQHRRPAPEFPEIHPSFWRSLGTWPRLAAVAATAALLLSAALILRRSRPVKPTRIHALGFAPG